MITKFVYYLLAANQMEESARDDLFVLCIRYEQLSQFLTNAGTITKHCNILFSWECCMIVKYAYFSSNYAFRCQKL